MKKAITSILVAIGLGASASANTPYVNANIGYLIDSEATLTTIRAGVPVGQGGELGAFGKLVHKLEVEFGFASKKENYGLRELNNLVDLEDLEIDFARYVGLTPDDIAISGLLEDLDLSPRQLLDSLGLSLSDALDRLGLDPSDAGSIDLDNIDPAILDQVTAGDLQLSTAELTAVAFEAWGLGNVKLKGLDLAAMDYAKLSFGAKIKVTPMLFNYRLAANKSGWAPYAGLGLGMSIVKTTAYLNIPSLAGSNAPAFDARISDSDMVFTGQIFAGVSYNFNDTAAVSLGLRYVHLGAAKHTISRVDTSVGSFDFETIRLPSESINDAVVELGFSFRF